MMNDLGPLREPADPSPLPTRPRRILTTRQVASILGAMLLVGPPAAWFAAGAPGAPAAIVAATSSAPDGVPPASPEMSDAGPAPVLRPEPESATVPGEVPVAEVSPFTSTAPRGAVDRSRWPSSLTIAALGVNAPVGSVGIGPGGELIIPDSPMDVGWFQGGAVPGEPGVALLTSHIDTRAEGRGVLSGLVRLSEGDDITVSAADGSVQRWSVIARTQHHKAELPAELFSLAGAPVLALVTCGGPFDSSTRSYRDNVIVWAELKG